MAVSKVLISSGHPRGSATKTEVIDLKNNNITCEDLQEFPLEISNAVGANLASWPIICGGIFNDGSTSDKCFIYMEGGWQHFVTMINRRSFTAGIVYDNAFHIFGGYDKDTSTTLQSSEIVNKDGSSMEGPQLPTPIQRHAIASINATVSIITGGTDTNSNQTWYFNHASQEFQQGPYLLEARWYHSSATITDQDTKEKIVIVVGGYDGNFKDTTEILSNGEWVAGINHKQFLYLSNYI